uniref:Uncharacterized protein n=1 Tax=Steinernema glaseri TaxID=37863 RepID=A0A1I7Y9P2_9BILA
MISPSFQEPKTALHHPAARDPGLHEQSRLLQAIVCAPTTSPHTNVAQSADPTVRRRRLAPRGPPASLASFHFHNDFPFHFFTKCLSL